MSERLAFVIVGGGIHGTHLAIRLIGEAGVAPASIRVLDPHPRLLERWRVCAANVGMRFLRSPAVHNLAVDPFALLRFAGAARHRPAGLFAPPYDRPSLALFEGHAAALLDEHGLDALHVRAAARRIVLDEACARVELDAGEALTAERVILAPGQGDALCWPPWAEALRGGPCAHVFEAGFAGAEPWPWRRVAVIGGGISAAQVALRLAADPLVEVTVVSRHPPREHQFDSDPGWLGPKWMAGFERERDLGRRRALITAARHRGSMPAELRAALRRAIREGSIGWRQDEVVGAVRSRSGVVLSTREGALAVDFVALATGYEVGRPGGALVDRLIREHGLPVAPCGFPRVDAALRWHPRLFVSGSLAELALGPVARNIAGARRAGDAIVGHLRRRAAA